MNKEDFDRVFDEALEDAVKNHLTLPDPDSSWMKVEEKLRIRRRKKRKFKLYSYAAAMMLLVITFVFMTPGATKAFSPFIQSIHKLQSGVISFFFGSNIDDEGEALTTPPPNAIEPSEGQIMDSGVLNETNYTSWEEASKHVEFNPPHIGYIPDTHQLNEVILFSKENVKAEKAVLLYTNPNEGQSWMLTFRLLKRNETLTTGSDTDAGEYQEVVFGNRIGYLFITKDGRGSLDYMLGNVVVSIAGSLTKEQILKVAENIG